MSDSPSPYRSQIAQSALFGELPWISTIVASQAAFSDIAPSLLLRLGSALDKLEKDEILQPQNGCFLRQLRLGQAPDFRIAQMKEKETFETNHVAVFRFVSLMLAYKLFDTVVSLSESRFSTSKLLKSRQGPFLEQQMFKLGYQRLAKDWSQVLENAKRQFDVHCNTGGVSLGTWKNVQTIPQLFASTTLLGNDLKTMKFFHNVANASIHVAYLLNGHLDLPEHIHDLILVLRSDFPDFDFQNFQYPTEESALRKLRLPLQLALAISPLMLLLPLELAQKETDRGGLIKMWAYLGNDKPAVLKDAENRVWKAILDVATSKTSLVASLSNVFDFLESENYKTMKGSYRSWFSSSYVSPEETPTPCVVNPAIGAGAPVDTVADAETLVNPGTKTVATAVNTVVNAGRGNMDRSSRERQQTPSNGMRSTSKDAAAGGQVKPTKAKSTKRKRAASDQVQVSEENLTSFKTREIIDLSSDLLSDDDTEMARLENRSISNISGNQSVRLQGPFDFEKEYKPKFCSVAMNDKFYKMVQMSQNVDSNRATNRDCADSAFLCLKRSDFDKKTAQDIQGIFRNQHIIVVDDDFQPDSDNVKMAFDKNSLLNVVRADRLITIEDLSVMPSVEGDLSKRLRQATVDSLLYHANREDGKPLNVFNTPMIDLPPPPLSIASEVWAWKQTAGNKLCKTREYSEYPSNAMRWATIATSGAYSSWSTVPHGLAAMVQVKAGLKYWIVGKRREDENSSKSFARIEDFLNGFDIEAPNDDRWSLEAMLLAPGMDLFLRPNTPYFEFTLDSSICHGRYFYATSTIRDTGYGICHTFLTGRILNKVNYEREASQLLLRLLSYNYDLVVKKNGSLQSEEQAPHVIDFRSTEGVIDFLTLHNIVELFNILYSRTYTEEGISPRDHHTFIELRHICRGILRYLNARMSMVTNWPTDLPQKSILSVQRSYLMAQIVGLLKYQGLVDREDEQDDPSWAAENQLFVSKDILYNEIKGSMTFGKELLDRIQEISKESDDCGLLATFLRKAQQQSTFGWPVSGAWDIKWMPQRERPVMTTTPRGLPNPDGKTPGDLQFKKQIVPQMVEKSGKRGNGDSASQDSAPARKKSRNR